MFNLGFKKYRILFGILILFLPACFLSGGNPNNNSGNGTPNPDPGYDYPGEDPDPGGLNSTYFTCNCLDGSDPNCIPGSDNNDGLTPETAWKTYDRAQDQFSSLNASESIAFCRGGSFEVNENSQNQWVNNNCQADNRCSVRDYIPPWGDDNLLRPYIYVQNGADAFRLNNGGNSEHQEGYIFRNLYLRGTQNQGRGFFLANDIDDVLIQNIYIDGFAIGVQNAGGNEPNPGSDRQNDRMIVRNSTIVNNAGQGLLGGASDCIIENNYFENNGFGQANLNHNLYWSGGGGGPTFNSIIRNNELYRSTNIDEMCKGVSLVVHGQHTNLLIEGNLVREDAGMVTQGCWGIAVDTGYESEEYFIDLTIRNNKVINVGGQGIGCTSCQNALIENNIIINDHNINTEGIRVPNRTRGDDDLPTTDVTIRNNSIYTLGLKSGIKVDSTDGENFVVVSNAINSESTCIDLNGPVTESHNACNVEFSSIEGPDYDLFPPLGSPLIDAGHPTLSSTEDYDGVSRPQGGGFDIGAYEIIP